MSERPSIHVDHYIAALERFALVLRELVRDLPATDARWKPPPPDHGAWSILEVIMHLCDEEVDDFRLRLRLTLENPKQDWPPIDPPRWAIERKYNDADLAQAVERFVRERRESVRWLRSLRGIDWAISYTHPKIGTIRAGDLLVSWAAHDALHLRQVAKRMHQLAQHHAGEFQTRYAGDWSA